MFVVISKFTVDNQDNLSGLVKDAFVARPHRVEQAAGFVRLDVLSPLGNPDEIWLLTYWTDQTSFQEWHHAHLYQEAHAQIPAGLRLISDRTEMLYFQHVAS